MPLQETIVLLSLIRRVEVHTLSFAGESPDHTVMVFYATLFAGSVGICKVNFVSVSNSNSDNRENSEPLSVANVLNI